MNEFVIKKAKEDDFREILRLLREAALWLQNKNITYWKDWINPPQKYIDWINSGIENEEFFLVIGEESIIGCYRLKWNDDSFWGKQKEPAGYIHSFTIDRKLHGNKIGWNVLKLIEEECRSSKKKYLRLDCSSEVHALRKYYESYGFQPVGETEAHGEKLTLYEKAITQK